MDTVHFGLPPLSMIPIAAGSLGKASSLLTLYPLTSLTGVGITACSIVQPSQYTTSTALDHKETRRRMRRDFRKRYGFGFFPCRGIIEGSAGDGKGESRRCRKPYLAANSLEFEDNVGVEFDDGTRRIAMVGGIWREERIILGDSRCLVAFDSSWESEQWPCIPWPFNPSTSFQVVKASTLEATRAFQIKSMTTQRCSL